MTITSLADLLDLQAIDLVIDRLLDRRQSLPELEEYRQVHERLQALDRRGDEAKATLRQLELDLDKSEGELQILESKLEENETRLFAGGMSARETEYMRLEVQSLRGQREAMEVKVLQMLESVDPARDAVADIEGEIETETTERKRLDGLIKAEWGEIDAEVARQEAKKAEALAPIDAELLDLYEKLRRLKEGVAVASYENNVCGGCHMSLSPTEHEEAMADELPRCVHCRRILVP